MSESRVARAEARRRRTRIRLVVAAVVAVALTVTVVGLLVRSGADPVSSSTSRRTTPSPSPTPLESVDLSALPIERQPFCDRIDAEAVETALGGPVSETGHYDSGDRVALAPGVTDVAHEFNCTLESSDGAQARAWVFAGPVTPRTGTSIVREARAAKGCTEVAGAPAYGTPSVATYCRSRKPATSSFTVRGLFGDAWFSCRLTTPSVGARAETVRRGEQWCLRLATTLGARP